MNKECCPRCEPLRQALEKALKWVVDYRILKLLKVSREELANELRAAFKTRAGKGKHNG